MATEVAPSSSSDRDGAGEETGAPSGVKVALWAYVAAQAVLLAAVLSLPRELSGVATVLIGVLGVGAFGVGVVRHRPEPRAGWWLLSAGAVTELSAAVAVVVVYGLRSDATISAFVPSGLAALALLLFASGVAVLGRFAPLGGPADILDTVMISLGAFVLLWAFVIDPTVNAGGTAGAAAVVFPASGLLLFTASARLVLGGGLRDPAIRLLLLAVATLLANVMLVLVPALSTDVLQASRFSGLLWALYGMLLGAAGLLLRRSAGWERDPGRLAVDDTSRWRMAVFAVLALLAPAAWMLEVSHVERGKRADVVGLAVPVVASAVLLLLLVARLSLMARVAQRRAGELARRSTALTEAAAEQEELQRQLAYRTLHDPLTGLPNRVVLTERMEWALTRRTGTRRHALLLFDLDGFKDINDTLGHPVGDEMLVEVSRRLLEAAPADATVARLGGDEFAVLLEDSDPETARRWAEMVLGELRCPYVIDGRELFVSASAGLVVTGAPHGPATASEALRDADLALYAAKGRGKNRVAEFQPHLRTTRLDHTRISTGLRRALANEEFVLHYQPIVDLATRTVVGVEALLRWQPPGAAPVPPSEFIPVAEDTGLIDPIGAWVLRHACHEARRWYDQHAIVVSVNVSARQLDDPEFTDSVVAALVEAGLPGEALIVEVTESSLVATNDTDPVNESLERLRAHGVRIAIDDFGTGYSSLSYVSRLPVDIVKIDRSFVQAHGPEDVGQPDWTFTRAVLQLVESLDLYAIAEGVETLEQAEALRSMNCALAQGYLFSRPVPAAVIDQTLAASPVLGGNSAPYRSFRAAQTADRGAVAATGRGVATIPPAGARTPVKGRRGRGRIGE